MALGDIWALYRCLVESFMKNSVRIVLRKSDGAVAAAL